MLPSFEDGQIVEVGSEIAGFGVIRQLLQVVARSVEGKIDRFFMTKLGLA
ncbi:hypothetical protein KBX72_02760 [Lacticaseibacillus paracasei]|nr:hypothetical protein [Lacticaseibacillus paracasei]MCP9377915.1 hypothetical protein [Lacticaseibacillus paracasei]